VQISAAVHPYQDTLAVQVSSELLLKPGANTAANSTSTLPTSPGDVPPPLQIGLDFPYGSEIMDVLGPVPEVVVVAKRPPGLLNVGTLSARMAVLRSCALDI
jgi:hypothetical protein